MDIRRPGRVCCAGIIVSFAFLVLVTLLAQPAAGEPVAFWSQPPRNDGSKISSEFIFDHSVTSEVAGDFVAEADGWVGTVAWWGGQYRTNESEATFFNLTFYEDDDCSPGVFPIDMYFAVEVTPVLVGVDGRGFNIYRYEAPVTFVVTTGTRYWVSIQAYIEDFPPQWGRMQAAEVRDCMGKFRSIYFGHENWVDASEIANSDWDASVEITMGEGPLEACCYPFFNLCRLLPAESCEADGGVPQGAGTVCDPNPCPVEQTQACCLPFGIGCQMLTVDLCEQATGTPQGEGTTCDPDPCGGPATQACCLSEGNCAMLTVELCTQAGGTPQGEGVDCDSEPCGELPAQACCYIDGRCEILTPSACSEAGGDTQYQVMSCEPNPCPQPQLRPCCFADKECEMLYEEDCYAQNGSPSEDGDLCIEVMCPLVIPTETTTWGQVRAMFR